MLLQLLERAEQSRTNQNSVVWTAVSVFAAAHSVLASAVAQLATAEPHPHVRTALLVAVIGLVFGLFGYVLVDRGLRLLKFQEEVQRNIERELGLAAQYTLSQDDSALYRKHIRGSFAAKPMLRRLCAGAILGWTIAFAWLLWSVK